jgi:hypothetical protein
LRDEQLRDSAQVDRSGLGEALHAGVGQRDDDTACVRVADAYGNDRIGINLRFRMLTPASTKGR